MASNRSQNPLFNILSGLGEMTAGGLHGYGAGKQAIAQQDQLKNLRESLGQQGYDTANLNPNQLQSLAYESAKAAPGKVAEQQKEMSGLANTSQLIKRAQELYEGTNTPETFGFLPKTESYRELDSILKKLKSNPYIKESGGVIPEASSRGVVPKLLNEAQEKLIEKYGQKLPQPQQTSQPSPQQDETPKLPQELVQPKSVQEKQQQQGSGLPLGLAGEAGSGVLGIPSLLARLGSGIQGAVSPLMPGHQTDPAQARAMLEKMGVPEDLIKQSEEFSQQPKNTLTDYLAENLPKREDIRKGIPGAEKEDASLEEKRAREFAGDLGESIALSVMTGGASGLKAILNSLLRSGIVEGAGNLSKYMTQKLGYDEDSGTTIKNGVSLLTAFGLGPSLRGTANKAYDKANKAIPAELMVDEKKATDVLSKSLEYFGDPRSGVGYMSDSMEKALFKPTYQNSFDFLKELQFKDFKSGSEQKAYVTALNNALKDGLKRQPDVPKDVIKYFKEADNVYHATKAVEEAGEFLKEIPRLGNFIKKGGWFVSLLGAGAVSPKLAAGGAAALVVQQGMKATKALQMASKYPAVRNAVNEMMKAGLDKNTNRAIMWSTRLLKSLNSAQKIEDQRKRK